MKNTEQKTILEENEIMRLTVKKVDSPKGEYMSSFESNGPQGPMMEALVQACGQFGLVCLPASVLGGIPAITAICMHGNPFAPSEDGEGTGEGPGNQKE